MKAVRFGICDTLLIEESYELRDLLRFVLSSAVGGTWREFEDLYWSAGS